jgi:pimeloyl-ACP methyl ester carboxylesterase
VSGCAEAVRPGRMKTNNALLLSLTLAAAAFGCRSSQDQKGTPAVTTTKTPETNTKTESTTKAAAAKRSGHLPVNGLDYYYEVHGQGEPLLLLHGGLGSIDMFGPVLGKLAETRQVIAVDLHGHGRTSLGDRKMSIPDMGDDMAAILDKLGYRQVDVMGYSLGAGVAFAPNPGDFPKLLDRIGELMRTPYDWKADIAKIQAPTMLVWGDSDMMRPEHMIEAYKLLGGGQKDAGWQRENMSKNRLAILPNVTHYELFMAPALVPTVLPFLDGNTAAPSWAAQVATKN